MVALSVDDAENATAMRDEFGFEFPVLYDTDTSVTREWGLYDLLGDGVSAPATFIIRTDGSIESALIGTNIGERPTADSIIEVLASLAAMEPASMGEEPADTAGGRIDVPAAAPAASESVPDFDLPTARGESVSISEFRGEKDIVLVFFRAWW